MKTIAPFLFIMAVTGNSIAAEPAKAIVSIEARLPGGEISNGTGFFFLDGKFILTCYHVIEGAASIEIIDSSRHTLTSKDGDFLVSAVSGKYDIAILQVKNGKAPASLDLDTVNAGKLTPSDSLDAYGNPQKIRGQRFEAKPTQDGFMLSGKLNDAKGNALCRLEYVNLIPLDMTIGNGMSGGPVLKGNKVVGILSGSLGPDKATVRTIAWAIPASYVTKESLKGFTVLDSKPERIRKWPKLELMSGNWKRLSTQPQQSAEISEKPRPMPVQNQWVLQVNNLNNKRSGWEDIGRYASKAEANEAGLKYINSGYKIHVAEIKNGRFALPPILNK